MLDRVAPLAIAAIAVAGIVACSYPTEPKAARPQSFNLAMNEDTGRVYVTYAACHDLYCLADVPESSSMTGRLTLGPESHDSTPPVCCSETFAKTYDNVTFISSAHDSLTGTATVDDTGRVRVFVSDHPMTGYHAFVFDGRIVGGDFSGRWLQSLDPHGAARLGSFETIPASVASIRTN